MEDKPTNCQANKRSTIASLRWLSIMFIFLLLSCGCNESNNEDDSSTEPLDSLQQVPDSIINAASIQVQFYYENSHSMDGYVVDGSYFIKNIYRLILDLNREYLFQGYFINDTIYPQEDLKSKIADKKFFTKGRDKSNHQYIYNRAIRTSGRNSISIVVTDGIYSKKGKDLDLVSLDIENDFYTSLKQRNLDMAVLKFETSFTGEYYSERCEKKEVQHLNSVTRPYYILMFAEKSRLDIILNKHLNPSHSELYGYIDMARFFKYHSDNVRFTLLESGEEKIGKFKGVGTNFSYNAIELQGKGPMDNGSQGIQFALAVDFSDISVPSSYLLDINNYELEGGDYILTDVKEISSLNKSSISNIEINDIQNAESNLNFTHMLVIRGEKDLFSKVHVKLVNNVPRWISESALDSDCYIVNHPDKTITFYELMRGINNAYKKVNNRAHFVSLEFEVKS